MNVTINATVNTISAISDITLRRKQGTMGDYIYIAEYVTTVELIQCLEEGEIFDSISSAYESDLRL